MPERLMCATCFACAGRFFGAKPQFANFWVIILIFDAVHYLWIECGLKRGGPLQTMNARQRKEQGPGAPLQGVAVALAIPLSGPEINWTCRVWLMGLPCIVSGTCG